ncbi:SUMF1/EgtB/PvdO family nonheme iron enzyme [Polyangium sp. 15x6]|uniref:formylglycine-generating enzyme family protein n=1 Tax=Polyangium sp. 15x6 TaxID=3042687 RepID=UPI00249C814D|nr:SUMF1/EgtB/PvdO family nonheme iron enzyme [Polyangium sp. 15x6]MDI3283139.1 SUMF1/EgtB/PvdO family nonheme iron enzyme [Polyangium sp. 15x6]
MRSGERCFEAARAWGARALGLGLGALVVACAPNLTTTGGAGGEGGDGSGGPGGSGGAGGIGGGGGSGGTIVCPQVPNTPTMVPVASASGNYCIDSTEVTNSQYATWLSSTEANEANQTPECAFNASYVPASGMMPPADDRPVAFVDWCDAYAFCKWYEKRLCGKIGGGPVPYSEINSAAVSQWYNACSRSETFIYPYGGSYDPAACNGQDRMVGNAVKVATQATCEGGLPGLFDMSGNVWEWEDACDGSFGENDTCRRRGGGYESIASDLDCPTAGGSARSTTNATTGFRCCVDVP